MGNWKIVSAALTIAVGIASTAWAVVVKVDVANASGQGVAGATVQIGNTTATTDASGGATLDITAQEGESATVIINFTDPISRKERRFSRRIEVTSQTPIAIGLPAFGEAGRGPFGPLSGWSIGPIFGQQDVKNTGLDAQTSTIVNQFGPTTQATTSGATSSADLAEENRGHQKDFSVQTTAGGRLHVPLWARRGPFSSATAFARGGLVQDGGGSGWRVYPSLMFGLSRADVELQSIDVSDASLSQAFGGDGVLLEAGANVVVFPCSDCGWYAAANYGFARTGEIDITRSPSLQSLSGAGVQVQRDGGRYRHQAHSLRGVVGHVFRHVAPYAGVRATSWEAELDLDFLMAFRLASGVNVTQTSSFHNEYRHRFVEALVGADIAIARTPMYLHVEGSTDGDSQSIAAALGFRFGR